MTDTDKENGKDVEGAPWWVRLVEGSKQFPGRVSQITKAIPRRCWTALMEFDHTSIWFYYVPASVQVAVMLLVVACNRPPDALDSGRVLGPALWVWKEIWSDAGQSMATVAIVSAILGDTGRFALVPAQKMYNEVKAQRDKRREAEKKAREEGREEERARFEAARAKYQEERTASAEWLARMQEAQQKGEPFDEAPPWEANGASES